jgi:AcrR family transcriptional regulator
LSRTPAGPAKRRRMTAAQRREVIERAATQVFAERGYEGASMDEIARRSGVSVPVVYDHFASKQDLHRCLLERHYAELRALWAEQLSWEGPPRQRAYRAFDAWFAYVQSHPYAWRMLFRDTTGDPAVQAIHRDVAAESRTAAMPLLGRELHAGPGSTPQADHALEMTWEVIRAALQGLALWWYEHQDIPRDQIVTTAMNTLWTGLEHTHHGRP